MKKKSFFNKLRRTGNKMRTKFGRKLVLFYERVTTEDGVEIEIDGDLVPGAEAWVITEDGEYSPAPDGTHIVDGQEIVILDGKIASVNSNGVMQAQDEDEENTRDDKETVIEDVVDVIEDQQDQLDDVKEELKEFRRMLKTTNARSLFARQKRDDGRSLFKKYADKKTATLRKNFMR